MIDEVRRVVMGEPTPGTSEFSHVEVVEPFELGDGRAWLIWGWDQTPTLPHFSAEPYVPTTFFPPPDTVRVSATRFGSEQSLDDGDARPPAELQSLIDAEPCGRVDHVSQPGMHRTDSIDIGVVVSGEIRVEAEDGAMVTLRPGDVYIQNGAMHNWHAAGTPGAHVVFVAVGARRAA